MTNSNTDSLDLDGLESVALGAFAVGKTVTIESHTLLALISAARTGEWREAADKLAEHWEVSACHASFSDEQSDVLRRCAEGLRLLKPLPASPEGGEP